MAQKKRNMKNVGGGSSVDPLKPIPAPIEIWEEKGGAFLEENRLTGAKFLQIKM